MCFSSYSKLCLQCKLRTWTPWRQVLAIQIAKMHFSAESAPTMHFVNMSCQESSHQIDTCLLRWFTLVSVMTKLNRNSQVEKKKSKVTIELSLAWLLARRTLCTPLPRRTIKSKSNCTRGFCSSLCPLTPCQYRSSPTEGSFFWERPN